MSILGIFRTTNDLVFVADGKGQVIEVNDAFTSVFGAVENGQSVGDFWPEIAEFWRDARAADKVGKQLRVDIPTVSGEERKLVFDVRLCVINEPDSPTGGFFGLARDVTAERAFTKNLETQSITDALTGVFNHSQIEVLLTQTIRSSRRRKSPGCFLFFDIDEFKKINDSYGHVEGDRILKEVASKLQDNLRGSDIVARFGGDEFAAILTDSNIENGLAKARQLVGNLSEIKPGGQEKGLRVSIGVAVFPDDGDEATEIIKKADRAMYHAKRQFNQNVSAWSVGLTE